MAVILPLIPTATVVGEVVVPMLEAHRVMAVPAPAAHQAVVNKCPNVKYGVIP